MKWTASGNGVPYEYRAGDKGASMADQKSATGECATTSYQHSSSGLAPRSGFLLFLFPKGCGCRRGAQEAWRVMERPCVACRTGAGCCGPPQRRPRKGQSQHPTEPTRCGAAAPERPQGRHQRLRLSFSTSDALLPTAMHGGRMGARYGGGWAGDAGWDAPPASGGSRGWVGAPRHVARRAVYWARLGVASLRLERAGVSVGPARRADPHVSKKRDGYRHHRSQTILPPKTHTHTHTHTQSAASMQRAQGRSGITCVRYQ